MMVNKKHIVVNLWTCCFHAVHLDSFFGFCQDFLFVLFDVLHKQLTWNHSWSCGWKRHGIVDLYINLGTVSQKMHASYNDQMEIRRMYTRE